MYDEFNNSSFDLNDDGRIIINVVQGRNPRIWTLPCFLMNAGDTTTPT